MRAVFLILTVMLAALVFNHISLSNGAAVHYHVADVISADNSRVTVVGSAKLGDQQLQLNYGGDVIRSHNLLTGSMEYDEFYRPGDRVVIALKGERCQVLALYRLPVLGFLCTLLVAGLLLYARRTGLFSILSFSGSVLIICGVLIPGLLHGFPPLLITGVTVLLLTAMIILSVAGWTSKGQAALAGCSCGLLITGLVCVVAGRWLHLDGMTQPLAQPLLFENAMQLDMLEVFYAAVLIGASGAAMDVAMEMAATMEEVQHKCPDICRRELMRSGVRVGNAVIGTMTTTLLLAYSGGFLTLLMLFASRGNSLMQILNMKLVSAEICRTLTGSLSLIIVAPLTAWIASYLLTRQHSSGGEKQTVGATDCP